MNKLILQNLKKHKIKVIIILFMLICLIIYTQKLYKHKNTFDNIEIPNTTEPNEIESNEIDPSETKPKVTRSNIISPTLYLFNNTKPNTVKPIATYQNTIDIISPNSSINTNPNTTFPSSIVNIDQQNSVLQNMYPPGSQPPVSVKACTADSDIVKVCLNYNDCCSNMTPNNQCFCNHPVVQQCKSDYDSCISANPQDTSKCATQTKSCCTAYNSVSINYNNFNKPINYEQTNNKLCSVQLIKNLPQKCLELCQTTPNCAAFSTNGDLYCNLYTAVDQDANEVSQNDIQEAAKSNVIKPLFNTKSKYYIKK